MPKPPPPLWNNHLGITCTSSEGVPFIICQCFEPLVGFSKVSFPISFLCSVTIECEESLTFHAVCSCFIPLDLTPGCRTSSWTHLYYLECVDVKLWAVCDSPLDSCLCPMVNNLILTPFPLLLWRLSFDDYKSCPLCPYTSGSSVANTLDNNIRTNSSEDKQY